MTDTTKKILIWSSVGVSLIIVYVVYKKMTAVTTILPVRTQIPGSPVTQSSLEGMATNLFKSAFGSGSNLSLSVGLTTNGKGAITKTDGTVVKVYDPNTGAYQVASGAWFLADGTALLQYDKSNGVYQESDGTWYTFDGTALSAYDPSTGNYSEEGDTTVYNRNGNPIS